MKKQNSFKETEIGKIPDMWLVGRLEDIAIEITDGSHFSPKENQAGTRIIATVKDLRQNGFDFSDCKHISTEDFEILKKNNCMPKNGDILVSKDGANCLEKIFVYRQKEEIVLLSSIAIVRTKNNMHPEFFRQYLLSPNAQKIMREGFVSGSAIPRITLSNLCNVPVPIPPFQEQKCIASILSSLDDKIELNRQMNATLEQIAQALFHRWFVEFEFPDERGRPFKSSGGKMVNSKEINGELPDGWDIKPLDQIANFLNGLALQKYPADGDEYLPVIKIREMTNGISDTSDKASKNLPEQYIVSDGDILFSWSGSLDVQIWCGGNGALNQHLFKVTSSLYPKWFYFYWIKEHLLNFQQIAAGKATTMGHIQRQHLTNARVMAPPTNTLRLFDKAFSPLINQFINNSIEIRKLALLRDSLLPQLMAGQIRVPA